MCRVGLMKCKRLRFHLILSGVSCTILAFCINAVVIPQSVRNERFKCVCDPIKSCYHSSGKLRYAPLNIAYTREYMWSVRAPNNIKKYLVLEIDAFDPIGLRA